jgi:maltooligosyltrehalose trehalohydrolase
MDLSCFAWTDQDWPGLDRDNLVIYELHVGTFSPEGTFDGVTRRLPLLRDLGVTAVELMPVGDFPGQRNWGYDGVAIFAPARCYGSPDDLQRLVDTAHRLGLGVLLDVVYNHLGPDGNYTGAYSPYYFSKAHTTPWGDALNLDGPHSRPVRDFFIENALHWLDAYHLDGLRLDATHAIVDDSPQHFLAELAERVRQSFPDRKVVLIAEDHRNLAHMVRPLSAGGWDLDAVWADDFHHEMRRLLAGDDEGYYRDYRGTVTDLAVILNSGWLYCGQPSVHLGGPRGTDPAGLAPGRFVICLQNHDQIGNRALGERLHHQIDLAAYRAASAVLLTAPQTPLLFMGQEWAASAPFLFFTDHHAELGRLITEGRRHEFRHFRAFTDPKTRKRIPDPQAEETFLLSRLAWEERERDPHGGVLALYRDLLRLRRNEPALRAATRARFEAVAWDADTLVHYSTATDGSRLLVVARLRGQGVIRLTGRPALPFAGHSSWHLLLHTEEPRFTSTPQPSPLHRDGDSIEIRFARPGAVLLGTGAA